MATPLHDQTSAHSGQQKPKQQEIQNPSNKPTQASPPSSRSTIGRLFSYLRPFWKKMALAALFLLLSSGAGLGFPWLLQYLLDSVFVSHNYTLLNQVALLLILVFLARSLFDFGQNYFVAFAGERLVANMRQQLYKHLQGLPLNFFSDWRTGEMMSRVTTDVVAIQNGLTTNILNLVQGLVMLIGSLVIILLLNWRLTLLFVTLVPVIVIIALLIGGRLKKASREVQQELGNVNTILEETLSTIRIVKAFGREPYEIQRFNTGIEQVFQVSLKRVRIRAVFAPIVNFVAFTAIVLVIWYGGNEVLVGHLSPGQLISFIIYMILIAEPFQSLSMIYTQMQEALGAAERIFELLDTEQEPPDQPGAIALPEISGEIMLDNVCFSYRQDLPVLHNISIHIRAGETVAFVGPSGAGKTTLLSLIPRLFQLTSGHIFIDGYDLQQVQLHSLREKIAIVQQEPVLFGGTIRENIAYGRLDASQADIEAAAQAANASEFITQLPDGYDSVVGERGVKLSVGQRQRITIARAILRNPHILMLDEATSALDNESEVLVQEALNRLMQHCTTLVIAHRLTTIEHADRIIVMEKGCIVEQGTHAELIARNGLYTRLYTRQFSEELAENDDVSQPPQEKGLIHEKTR